MFYYIFKDFKSTIKTQRFLTVILICIQLISTIIIFFAYGVINHYNTQIGVTEGTDLAYVVDRINPETGMPEGMSYEEVMRFYEVLKTKYEYKMECFITLAEAEIENSKGEKYEDLVRYMIRYINGEYTVGCETFRRGTLNWIVNNAYIYNNDDYIIEQFDNEEYVVLIPEEYVTDEKYINLFGDDYKIIGLKSDGVISSPFCHMPEDGKYIMAGMCLSRPLLQTEYEEYEEIVESCFGTNARIDPEFNGIKNENQYRVYKSIIAILAAFVVMSGINYCIIFSHILDKRSRMLAVSRICGCTGIKSIMVYMIELMSVSIVTLIVGMLIFIYGILPNIKSTFEYIEYYLNTKVYIQLALGYVGILLIIYLGLVFRFTRKTPVRLMKEV